MDHSERKQSSAEQVQWEHLVESTFERPEHKIPVAHSTPAVNDKVPSSRKKWLWIVLAAVSVVAIAAACILPSLFEKEERASIPDALIPCKEALDQWQSLDSCMITRDIQFYGDNSGILAAIDSQAFWKSGSDWILINHYPHVDLGNTGQMYRDGILYKGYGSYSLTWTPTDAEPEENPIPWLMTFSWENCDLIHIVTEENHFGKHIIFGVVEKDPEQPFYDSSPYNVCFSFDPNGRLECIAVELAGSDFVSGMAITVSTYRLVSDDADAIAKAIQAEGTDVTGAVDYPE